MYGNLEKDRASVSSAQIVANALEFLGWFRLQKNDVTDVMNSIHFEM